MYISVHSKGALEHIVQLLAVKFDANLTNLFLFAPCVYGYHSEQKNEDTQEWAAQYGNNNVVSYERNPANKYRQQAHQSNNKSKSLDMVLLLLFLFLTCSFVTSNEVVALAR